MIRYEDVQIVDNRITIVAKDILNLDIYTESGCIVYSEGDQLFYNDIYGTKHRVGTVWSLGENSKQYVLFNGQYRIDNIDIASENSSIRLDYCNYGLSENCVRYENINNKTKKGGWVVCTQKMELIQNVHNSICLLYTSDAADE